MVTYLKTLIYIQDASCAGLRVWLAISGIFAGFRFLSASSGFSFVRPGVSESSAMGWRRGWQKGRVVGERLGGFHLCNSVGVGLWVHVSGNAWRGSSLNLGPWRGKCPSYPNSCYSLFTAFLYPPTPTPHLVLLYGKEGGREEVGKARSRINVIKFC